VLKINDLEGAVFSGLSALVIEDVKDEGGQILVMARTRSAPVPCPMCGALTGRVHGYGSRTVTDVPVDGRRVVVSVQVQRLLCPARGCARQTFRERGAERHSDHGVYRMGTGEHGRSTDGPEQYSTLMSWRAFPQVKAMIKALLQDSNL
jgi:transposase